MLRPPQEFITARLRLRPPDLSDAPAMFERWARDPEVTRYLVWQPHGNVAQTKAHVLRCMEGWQSGDEFVWLLEDRETGELVGSLAARHDAHGVNVGYLVARDSWGRGYMVEALEAVTRWFLAQPAVHRVWATCDVENAASARVLEKAGFEFEGILRRWAEHPGADADRRDARCYSRISQE